MTLSDLLVGVTVIILGGLTILGLLFFLQLILWFANRNVSLDVYRTWRMGKEVLYIMKIEKDGTLFVSFTNLDTDATYYYKMTIPEFRKKAFLNLAHPIAMKEG